MRRAVFMAPALSGSDAPGMHAQNRRVKRAIRRPHAHRRFNVQGVPGRRPRSFLRKGLAA